MSKSDRFKEEIGGLKALCGLLLASCMSLMVWLVQNYGATSRVCVACGALVFTGARGRHRRDHFSALSLF